MEYSPMNLLEMIDFNAYSFHTVTYWFSTSGIIVTVYELRRFD